MIALMEYFQDTRNIQSFKRKLEMKHVKYNVYGQIWVFIKDHNQVGVIADYEQQLTLQLNF